MSEQVLKRLLRTCPCNLSVNTIRLIVSILLVIIVLDLLCVNVIVCCCGNIYYIFGQVQRLMFDCVNFSFMFKIFGHIHLVILNWSCTHSSFFRSLSPFLIFNFRFITFTVVIIVLMSLNLSCSKYEKVV